ncbi:reverse transcriptase domain-containing protein [Tanacetum coccineum]
MYSDADDGGDDSDDGGNNNNKKNNNIYMYSDENAKKEAFKELFETTSSTCSSKRSNPLTVYRPSPILPIIAEKVHQEKLKAVKARLNFEEASRHSESGTPSRRSLKERLRPRHARSMSGSPEPRRGRSKSPRERDPERRTVFKRLEKGVFHMLGDMEKNVSAHSRDSRHRSYHSNRRDTESCYQSSRFRETKVASEKHFHKKDSSQRTKALSESEGSVGGHWKSKPKKQKSSVEDDLSQPWVCEETDPLTPRIRYFDFLKTRMPSHIKTYDGSEDPEDHLKIFQAAAKTERWAMPTWCHMFISTLTGNARVWFDDLPNESIDSYDDLRKTFLENYLQQKKCIKDPVEIHNIKQRDGESTKEFMRRYKLECRDLKGAPECMKIFGFMHGITNPELIKRLHDKIPKSVNKMMRVTTAFLRGEVVASSHERKKLFPSWKQQQVGQKQNFKKGSFRNQQRTERKQDRFTLLIKTPKEILALDKGEFKPPPPMTTPVEKRNASKFYEFHGEVGHTTDERIHLKRQIEEMLKAEKLSYLIKELKQNNGKDETKTAKKRETSGKDKSLAILMVQPWQRIARQRITQTFSPESVISFPPLGEEDGTEGPMIIEAEMGGHCVHRMYVDRGSSSEILYEHCFNRFCPEVKNQMIPAATPLVGFSEEVIWPLGQISLLVKICDEEHSTSAWMNFMVVRSPFPYNGIIWRPEERKIRAIPSTAHEMLKFLVAGGIVTLRSSRTIPLECTMVSGPGVPQPVINQVTEEKIQVAIHPEYPKQTVAIGSTLTEEGRRELCGLLRRNLDIFA